MSNKECSINKPLNLVNNNLFQEVSSNVLDKKVKNLPNTVAKDEKTIFLEGGNYVAFMPKKRKKNINDSIEVKTDGNTENVNSSDKLTNCPKTPSNENSSKKKVSRHNKKYTPRSKNTKRRRKSHRTKYKGNCNSVTLEYEIEAQAYYHGLRPVEDFEHFFTNAGDFLIHLSPIEQELKYCLVVMNFEKKLEFYIIDNDNGRYYLTLLKKYCKNFSYFRNIPLLVEHYKKFYIRDKLFLKCKLKRPSNYIDHALFSYDIKNDIIGQGNFATVYKGILCDNEVREINVAIKVFSPWNENDTYETKTDRLLQILNEARIMKHLNNENVVRLYGVAIDKLPICIIMDLCSGGSLENHLKIEKDKICIAERLFYCYDILSGACYLSSNNVIHRDLAARNILISDDGYLKIADFGQAIQLNEQNSQYPKIKNKVISLWSPPECLSNDSIAWSEKSDVWSFGILAIEIFNDGQPPFKKEDAVNVVSQLKKGIYFEIPKTCHEDWSLVLREGVFIKEQRNRFDFKQLKELLKALLTYNVNLSIPKSDSIILNHRGVKRNEFKVSVKKKR